MTPLPSLDNITKKCLVSGEWDNYTNYRDCLAHQIEAPDKVVSLREYQFSR